MHSRTIIPSCSKVASSPQMCSNIMSTSSAHKLTRYVCGPRRLSSTCTTTYNHGQIKERGTMISSNHRASLFYKESLCRTLPILKVYMAKDGPQGQIVGSLEYSRCRPHQQGTWRTPAHEQRARAVRPAGPSQRYGQLAEVVPALSLMSLPGGDVEGSPLPGVAASIPTTS